MKTKLFCVSAFCLFFATQHSNATETTIACRLEIDKRSFRLGDTIHFKLDYKNVGSRPLWLVTENETHLADVFVIRDLANDRKVERIFLPGETDIAWDVVAEQAIRLKPNETVSRVITARIEWQLPPFFGRNTKGVFMVFSGSALELPGIGNYAIQARFNSSPNSPVTAFLPKHVKLWYGRVLSNVVPITIGSAK